MLGSRKLLIRALALSMLVINGVLANGTTALHNGLSVSDVIAEVKRELAAAQNATGANVGLSLQTVELKIQLTRTTDANGKIIVGIPVFSGAEIGGGAGQKSQSMSSVDIELAVPKGAATMSATDIQSMGIAKAIIDTRAQLLKGIDQPPRLTPKKVVITLAFVVTREGGPTGQIKLLVFSAEGGVTFTAENAQTIILTFALSNQP